MAWKLNSDLIIDLSYCEIIIVHRSSLCFQLQIFSTCEAIFSGIRRGHQLRFVRAFSMWIKTIKIRLSSCEASRKAQLSSDSKALAAFKLDAHMTSALLEWWSLVLFTCWCSLAFSVSLMKSFVLQSSSFNLLLNLALFRATAFREANRWTSNNRRRSNYGQMISLRKLELTLFQAYWSFNFLRFFELSRDIPADTKRNECKAFIIGRLAKVPLPRAPRKTKGSMKGRLLCSVYLKEKSDFGSVITLLSQITFH